MLPSASSNPHKRVVELLDVDAKQVVGREVFVTLETSVRMKLVVVTFIVAVGPETNGFCVRGE